MSFLSDIRDKAEGILGVAGRGPAAFGALAESDVFQLAKRLYGAGATVGHKAVRYGRAAAEKAKEVHESIYSTERMTTISEAAEKSGQRPAGAAGPGQRPAAEQASEAIRQAEVIHRDGSRDQMRASAAHTDVIVAAIREQTQALLSGQVNIAESVGTGVGLIVEQEAAYRKEEKREARDLEETVKEASGGGSGGFWKFGLLGLLAPLGATLTALLPKIAMIGAAMLALYKLVDFMGIGNWLLSRARNWAGIEDPRNELTKPGFVSRVTGGIADKVIDTIGPLHTISLAQGAASGARRLVGDAANEGINRAARRTGSWADRAARATSRTRTVRPILQWASRTAAGIERPVSEVGSWVDPLKKVFRPPKGILQRSLTGLSLATGAFEGLTEGAAVPFTDIRLTKPGLGGAVLGGGLEALASRLMYEVPAWGIHAAGRNLPRAARWGLTQAQRLAPKWGGRLAALAPHVGRSIRPGLFPSLTPRLAGSGGMANPITIAFYSTYQVAEYLAGEGLRFRKDFTKVREGKEKLGVDPETGDVSTDPRGLDVYAGWDSFVRAGFEEGPGRQREMLVEGYKEWRRNEKKYEEFESKALNRLYGNTVSNTLRSANDALRDNLREQTLYFQESTGATSEDIKQIIEEAEGGFWNISGAVRKIMAQHDGMLDAWLGRDEERRQAMEEEWRAAAQSREDALSSLAQMFKGGLGFFGAFGSRAYAELAQAVSGKRFLDEQGNVLPDFRAGKYADAASMTASGGGAESAAVRDFFNIAPTGPSSSSSGLLEHEGGLDLSPLDPPPTQQSDAGLMREMRESLDNVASALARRKDPPAAPMLHPRQTENLFRQTGFDDFGAHLLNMRMSVA